MCTEHDNVRDRRGGPGTLIRSLSGYHSALQHQVGSQEYPGSGAQRGILKSFHFCLSFRLSVNTVNEEFFSIKMFKL